MGVVTTSLVVELGGAASDSAIFNVQIDDREDGLNNGKTSFLPGDDIYLLLFKTSGVTVIDYLTSQGYLVPSGVADYPVEGFATFPVEKEFSLSYPVPAGRTVTKQWLGNDLGNSTIKNESIIALSADDATLGERYVGVMKYSYTAQASVYRLTDTLINGVDVYQILCYFAGESA